MLGIPGKREEVTRRSQDACKPVPAPGQPHRPRLATRAGMLEAVYIFQDGMITQSPSVHQVFYSRLRQALSRCHGVRPPGPCRAARAATAA